MASINNQNATVRQKLILCSRRWFSQGKTLSYNKHKYTCTDKHCNNKM